MLKDLTSEKLICLDIEAENWEDAVRKSAAPLLNEGKIKSSYVEEIISTAKKIGPYFVLAKHVALPHARPEAGALENAIGVARLKTPVEFGNAANDPVKYLFCLSAQNSEDHIDALAELAERLDDSEFFRLLDEAQDAKEFMDYLRQQ